jgi:hypothetical protein
MVPGFLKSLMMLNEESTIQWPLTSVRPRAFPTGETVVHKESGEMNRYILHPSSQQVGRDEKGISLHEENEMSFVV